jgi:hypothetical protein
MSTAMSPRFESPLRRFLNCKVRLLAQIAMIRHSLRRMRLSQEPPPQKSQYSLFLKEYQHRDYLCIEAYKIEAK